MKKVFKILLIFLPVVFSTCTKTMTESENFSLTGKVTLEGQAAHNGITVALYPLAVLDTAIVNMQKNYPTVGVQISQATEFDHRLSEPVYQTTTDKDGNYVLENIAPAEYNLVVEKKGFGWRYLYNVNNTTKPKDIELLQEIQVQGTLGNYTVWNENQHYIVTDNITIPENSTLIIEPGVVIRFNGYFKLNIYGKVFINGTDNELISLVSNYEKDESKWNPIYCERGSVLQAKNFKIKNADTGIEGKECDVEINKFYIESKSANSSIRIYGKSKININSGLFRVNGGAVTIESFSSGKIENNFISALDYNKETYGIHSSTSSLSITNNVICNIGTGMKIEYESDVLIKNNYIINCNYGLDIGNNYEQPICTIIFNTIENCSTCLIYFWVYNYHVINNNNFLQQDDNTLFVRVERFANFLINNELDVENNFWGTNSVEEIRRKIFDIKIHDNIINPDTGSVYDILIEPIINSKLNEAYPE